MSHISVATNLVTTTSINSLATWTSDAITLSPGAIATQIWLKITATYGGVPAGNTMVRAKVCPLVGETLFDDGPDVPFTVSAATTYNYPIMLSQLPQSCKITVTNDTTQTLTLSVDIEYVEVA